MRASSATATANPYSMGQEVGSQEPLQVCVVIVVSSRRGASFALLDLVAGLPPRSFQNSEGMAGIEPATCGLGNRCSIR